MIDEFTNLWSWQYATYAAHQMVPRPLWNTFESNKCRNDLTAAKCQDIMAEIDSMTADVDPYALDFPVCGPSTPNAPNIGKP
jgi:hypothetical protein